MKRRAQTSRKAPPPFEPLHRSVYIGRAHLGTYVQTARKKFEAFPAGGRSLGKFQSAKVTLAAIRKNSVAREAAE